MLKSRKFLIWAVTMAVFVLIIGAELFLKRENLNVAELGIALTGLSGIYYNYNVKQKKDLKE